MSLKLQSVFDKSFSAYGRVLDGYSFDSLISALEQTQAPTDGVAYVPSVESLEASATYADMVQFYGGMPIQIGYCNGVNTKLNCLEYHRDSEVNIAATDMILLLGKQSDVEDWKYDTSKVEAFLCPKGTAVEVFATGMHYAPCSAKSGATFKVAVVLPKGTNTDKPAVTQKYFDDRLLFAKNKWLIAHPEASEVSQGAYVGLVGENIDIAELIK